MAGRVSVDTSFLIDLQRERRRGVEGGAHAVLETHAEAELLLSAVALGEFAAGFGRADAPVLTEVRRRFQVVPVDEAVGLVYREIDRHLKERGELIGGNDLWIAATARGRGVPLVTRNVDEFRRVPGLEVIGYLV